MMMDFSLISSDIRNKIYMDIYKVNILCLIDWNNLLSYSRWSPTHARSFRLSTIPCIDYTLHGKAV